MFAAFGFRSPPMADCEICDTLLTNFNPGVDMPGPLDLQEMCRFRHNGSPPKNTPPEPLALSKPPPMKPTSSSKPPRPRNFHSPDHYASQQQRSFRDGNLGGFLLALVAASVVFGIVLVMQ